MPCCALHVLVTQIRPPGCFLVFVRACVSSFCISISCMREPLLTETPEALQQEGAWDSQRSQPQTASAPNSGSKCKSSALEDSAKESVCPAELDTMERVCFCAGCCCGHPYSQQL